jgi:hypothetical protein
MRGKGWHIWKSQSRSAHYIKTCTITSGLFYNVIETQLNPSKTLPTKPYAALESPIPMHSSLELSYMDWSLKLAMLHIATISTTYRDTVLKMHIQLNKAGTDPRIIVDM